MIFERRQYNVWRQFYWDGSFCCKCEVPKCSLLRPASLSCDVSLLSSLVSRVNSIKCRSIVSFRLEFRQLLVPLLYKVTALRLYVRSFRAQGRLHFTGVERLLCIRHMVTLLSFWATSALTAQ